ncbi:hypothetical protein MPSEU_000945100 [Mayamaea pseudoterrestris]|nr:hypothetical protein MPSEU_000945100 [Mayamaea pseudoterrestris]
MNDPSVSMHHSHTATPAANTSRDLATVSSSPLTSASSTQAVSPRAAPTSFIFAYGSLICPHSRALTAPSMANVQAIPVRVTHLERHFSMPTGSWTAMGVRFRRNATCVGVLLAVTKQELRRFDKRELGYDRNLLPPEHVEYLETDGKAAEQQQQMEESPPKLIWVYIQQRHVPPSIRNPIAQSYVDIILRGCLTVSEDFAKEFILTTGGWFIASGDAATYKIFDAKQPATATFDRATANGEQQQMLQVHWVNDRHDPLYIRADAAYSMRAARILDALLQLHVPLAMERRKLYGRS